MSRDPKVDQLLNDVNSLKQKVEHQDTALVRIETKLDSIDKEVRGLYSDIGGIKGTWGTLKAVIPIIGLLGIGAYLVSLNSTVSTHGERIAKLETKVEDVQKRLDKIDINLDLIKDQLRKINASQVLPEAEQLIQQLKEKKDSPSVEKIAKIGQELVEFSKKKTDVEASKTGWQYANELASYLTSVKAGGASEFDPRTLSPNGVLLQGGIRDVTVNRQGVVLEGDFINCTFIECLIIFQGARVVIKDSKFVNCYFRLPQAPVTEKLLLAIFTKPTVTVESA